MQSSTSERERTGRAAGTDEREAVPFATATVATIYLDQGKLDQAEQIFRHVLESEPDNRRCRDGLAEIKRRRQADSADAADAVHAELTGADAKALRITCRYRISGDGRDRARMVSGEEGQLILRLVGFPADQEAKPLDTQISGNSGELSVDPPPGATLAAVAIGLLGAGGTFVSIAHSKIIQIAG